MITLGHHTKLINLLSTHHVTNHLTCRSKSDGLKLDLKNMKIQCQKYQKMQFCIQLYVDIW